MDESTVWSQVVRFMLPVVVKLCGDFKDYEVIMNWLEVINNISDMVGVNISKIYDKEFSEGREAVKKFNICMKEVQWLQFCSYR